MGGQDKNKGSFLQGISRSSDHGVGGAYEAFKMDFGVFAVAGLHERLKLLALSILL